MRADASGFIAQTPHPHALGSALTHPRITTDYSESLLELITPVYDTTAGMLEALGHTHQFVQQNLGDEVFWAASMPCGLDGDSSIPIANYGSSNVGKMKHVYRQGLGGALRANDAKYRRHPLQRVVTRRVLAAVAAGCGRQRAEPARFQIRAVLLVDS
ncbi:MAG: glutamate--cysteine ligase [Marinobacter sp.]|nr:glutamate--cysteine ligase [Marinobacter sp.]